MLVDVNDVVVVALSDYCKNRNFRCSGCRFAIDKYMPKPEYICCIFGNAPVDWKDMYTKEYPKENDD